MLVGALTGAGDKPLTRYKVSNASVSNQHCVISNVVGKVKHVLVLATYNTYNITMYQDEQGTVYRLSSNNPEERAETITQTGTTLDISCPFSTSSSPVIYYWSES